MPAGTYGRQTLGTTGYPVLAIASDPAKIDWKIGGGTIDWGLVTAAPADLTLPDGNVILSGRKYLRYGQILTQSGRNEVQTVTQTGGPTGGSQILTAPALSDGAAADFTVSAAATAAQFQSALSAVYSVSEVASVSRSGAGSAADPYVYSISFARRYGNVDPILNVSNTFTGGTTPSSTIAQVTAGLASGLFGPYDSAASDGTQLLTRGECFILNETVLEVPAMGWGVPQTTVLGGLFDGGLVFKERIIMTTGTASKAAGPTVANFETAFPRIEYALNN